MVMSHVWSPQCGQLYRCFIIIFVFCCRNFHYKIWWLLMTSDDYWWLLMTADDYWWLLMTTDDFWWLLVSTDDYWPQEGCWWLLNHLLHGTSFVALWELNFWWWSLSWWFIFADCNVDDEGCKCWKASCGHDDNMFYANTCRIQGAAREERESWCLRGLYQPGTLPAEKIWWWPQKRNEMRFPNLYFTVSWGTWLVFNKECSSFIISFQEDL